MSIRLKTLYADVAKDLGLGTGNERLSDAFPRAVNRALDELAVAGDVAGKFTHVSSIDDTVSDLSDHYEYMLYAGVAYYLIRMGFKPGDSRIASVIYDDSDKRWEQAKADYIMDVDNLAAADRTESVIGRKLADED